MSRISFDKFKILLTFKLSGLRTKRIFTPYGDLITGRKGGFSVSATVCENKELALKRITFKLHELNFAIGEGNKDEEIEVRGKKVVFCNPEDFIQFFKNKFRFKVSSREIIDYDITEEFIKSFEDKTEALAILNSMYLLYVYREFPEVFIHTKDTRVRMEIEPDIPLLEKVKNLGYGFSHPKTSHPKVRMNYLTDDGREIARSVFEHKLINSLTELETVIKKFGRRKVLLMTSGTLRKDGMFLKVREPDSVISLKGDTTPNILSNLYISDKSLFKELKDVQTPLQLISRFITLFAIYDEAIRFFNELEKMGLAIKSRIFSKWGVELGMAYRAPPELAEFLMEQCYFEMESEVVEEFVKLFTGMYLKAIEGIAGERMLNELFMGLDMEPIEVKRTPETSQLEMAELISSILSES
ncbi:hypothetical protein DRP07_09745 [Archaeoglobales archaeon]|nr:MAG: hypothetical protein DRP07_09745 [Archaeoglobales archaeon]